MFGIFAGFWLSYAVLVLGLTHNWFGVAAASVQATQELFLVAWLVVMVMLTLATLRLPVAFTAVFSLVDLALLLVFLGVNQGSTGLLKTAGYVVLVFAASACTCTLPPPPSPPAGGPIRWAGPAVRSGAKPGRVLGTGAGRPYARPAPLQWGREVPRVWIVPVRL